MLICMTELRKLNNIFIILKQLCLWSIRNVNTLIMLIRMLICIRMLNILSRNILSITDIIYRYNNADIKSC